MSAGGNVFDPDTLVILKAVLEEACLALGPSQHIPGIRSAVAKRILRKAGQGERDPARLRAYALMDIPSLLAGQKLRAKVHGRMTAPDAA